MSVDISQWNNTELDMLNERLEKRRFDKFVKNVQSGSSKKRGIAAPPGYKIVDPQTQTVRRSGGYIFKVEDLGQEISDLSQELRNVVAHGRREDVVKAFRDFDNITLGRVERGVEEYGSLDTADRREVDRAIQVATAALAWSLSKVRARARELEETAAEFERRIKIPHPVTVGEKVTVVVGTTVKAAVGSLASIAAQGLKSLLF